MAEKKFVCEICGKEHESIEAKIKCLNDCYKKQEEEKKRIEAEKLKEEKQKAYDLVMDTKKAYEKVLQDYCNKYGTFSCTTTSNDDWHYTNLFDLLFR